MLSFDVSVSGGQVGNALSNDPEELGYALVALAESGLGDYELTEISDAIYGVNNRREVVTLLRKIADRLEAG